MAEKSPEASSDRDTSGAAAGALSPRRLASAISARLDRTLTDFSSAIGLPRTPGGSQKPNPDRSPSLPKVGSEITLEVRHPTGVYRNTPLSTFENTFFVRRDGVLMETCTEPSQNPTLSPLASPTQSPRTVRRSWWYKNHCKLCCSRMNLPEYRPGCEHYDDAVPLPIYEHEAQRQHGPFFGEDLTVAYMRDEGVPHILRKCVEQIELWCDENPKEALHVYLISATPKEIFNVTTAFNSGQSHTVTTAEHDVHAISGALKMYLLSLPNPVIAAEFYDQFIRLGKDDDCGYHVDGRYLPIYNEMPACNREILAFIIKHLGQLSNIHESSLINQLQVTGNETLLRAKDYFRNNICLFSQLLMRPPWKTIRDFELNAVLHTIILYEIMLSSFWGPYLPTFRKPVLLNRDGPPGIQILCPKLKPNVHLQEYDWYWKGTSHKFTNKQLMKEENGSFLVRDSKSHDGDYELLVKVCDLIVTIRIMHKDDLYGFVEPLDWHSVVCLITWHYFYPIEAVDFKEPIYLKNAIRRITVERLPHSNTPQDTWHYAVITATRDRLDARHSYVNKKYIWYLLHVDIKQYLLEVVIVMRQITADRIVVKECMLDKATTPDEQESPEVQELMQELAELYDRIAKCDYILEKMKLAMETYRVELCMVKCEATTLQLDTDVYSSQVKELKAHLLAQPGFAEDYLEYISNLNLEIQTIVSLTLYRENMWLRDVDFEAAKKLLKGKCDGTFLIFRSQDVSLSDIPPIDPMEASSLLPALSTTPLSSIPVSKKSSECPYLLAIKVKGDLISKPLYISECKNKDCKYPHQTGNGYTLSKNCPRFRTLLDFVKHFHFYSLACYGNDLPTTLAYPLGWPNSATK